jgi:hypothetical protein
MGKLAEINDVLFVNEVTKSLLLVGTIADRGTILVFSKTKCQILDEAIHEVIAIASRQYSTNLYKMATIPILPHLEALSIAS